MFNFKIKKETIDLLSQYGNVSFEGKLMFFEINNYKYQIHFLKVNKRRELFVNNKTTFEILPGNLLIRPNYLHNYNLKIIIVYPTSEKPKVYLNENTVEFINQSKTYHFHVTLFSELEELLKTLND